MPSPVLRRCPVQPLTGPAAQPQPPTRLRQLLGAQVQRVHVGRPRKGQAVGLQAGGKGGGHSVHDEQLPRVAGRPRQAELQVAQRRADRQRALRHARLQARKARAAQALARLGQQVRRLRVRGGGVERGQVKAGE